MRLTTKKENTTYTQSDLRDLASRGITIEEQAPLSQPLKKSSPQSISNEDRTAQLFSSSDYNSSRTYFDIRSGILSEQGARERSEPYLDNLDLNSAVVVRVPEETPGFWTKFGTQLVKPFISIGKGEYKKSVAVSEFLTQSPQKNSDALGPEKQIIAAFSGDVEKVRSIGKERRETLKPLTSAAKDSDVQAALSAEAIVAVGTTKVGTALIKGGLALSQGYTGAKLAKELTPEALADFTLVTAPAVLPTTIKALKTPIVGKKASIRGGGTTRGGKTVRSGNVVKDTFRTGQGRVTQKTEYAITESGKQVLKGKQININLKQQPSRQIVNSKRVSGYDLDNFNTKYSNEKISVIRNDGRGGYSRPASQVRTPGPYNARNMGQTGTSTQLQQLQQPKLTRVQRRELSKQVSTRELAIKNYNTRGQSTELLQKPIERQLPSSSAQGSKLSGRDRVKAQLIEKLRMKQNKINEQRTENAVKSFFEYADSQKPTPRTIKKGIDVQPIVNVPRGYRIPQTPSAPQNIQVNPQASYDSISRSTRPPLDIKPIMERIAASAQASNFIAGLKPANNNRFAQSPSFREDSILGQGQSPVQDTRDATEQAFKQDNTTKTDTAFPSPGIPNFKPRKGSGSSSKIIRRFPVETPPKVEPNPPRIPVPVRPELEPPVTPPGRPKLKLEDDRYRLSKSISVNRFKQPKRYTPSAFSAVLNIKGRGKGAKDSGLGIRPIRGKF